MKPIRLKMEAFGSYGKETVIDFTKPSQNLFLITGDTGSGKSTIFDAIVFALYGQAGAADNSKGGFDLQSQYAGVSVTPYVELLFSEMRGGEEKIYRIRRQPQHVRMNKRGGGTSDEKEQVEIFRPDNSHDVASVNQKQKDKNEINQEIIDIVGLTKEQFMQVAMIAQGDFTRLIKANTDERKPIFRKIFNTGIYEKIIDVLSKKNKELSNNINLIKNGIKNEVTKIRIPEDYPERSTAETCKSKIVSNDKWTTVDLEELMPELKKLCQYLSDKNNTANANLSKADKKRIEANNKFTEANALIKSFTQLEEAQQKLDECAGRKEEMKQNEKLKNDIHKAYEINGVYELLENTQTKLNKYNNDLKKLKEELPNLIKTETEAENRKKQLNADFQEKQNEFTRIDGDVEKALEVFGDIRKAIKEENECKKKENAAAEEKEKAEQAMNDFEEQLKKWKEEQNKLSESGTLLERIKNECEKIEQAKRCRNTAENAEKERDKQKKAAEESQKKYREAQKKFDVHNDEYLKLRKAFYNAQAGIMAKELEDGMPCPVCGSLSHPAPCKLTAEHKDLTQEYIDKLEREVSELDNEQQKLSADSGTANELLKEKDTQVQKEYENLMHDMQNAGITFTEPLDLSQIKKDITEKQHETDERKEALKKDKDRYDELSELIASADTRHQKLVYAQEQAVEKYNKASALYITAKASRMETEKQKTFATEQEAKDKLSHAENICKESKKLFDVAEQAYNSAKSACEQTKANIKTLEEQTIPAQQREAEEYRNKYIDALKKSDMAENEWMNIVQLHKKEEHEELMNVLKEYNDTVLAAETKKKTAESTIGDKTKPDIELLKNEIKSLEEAYDDAKKLYQSIYEDSNNNNQVFDSLTSDFNAQKDQMLKCNRIEHLHKKLAGTETGSEKTDIETIVQRIYLERILNAANRRFLEMSSDQFEFRMMDISKSSGKDRGLELMVRSTITGKEQEVKMLSGGESFIAALSLALGMSDQIQQNSAFVNLDIMFIDEGFGSLDANTRNQAIKVLKNMAENTKMIGIISHVSELQQQIDDKLVVERDRSGSSAHWIVS